jgi:hypothetical protein
LPPKGALDLNQWSIGVMEYWKEHSQAYKVLINELSTTLNRIKLYSEGISKKAN